MQRKIMRAGVAVVASAGVAAIVSEPALAAQPSGFEPVAASVQPTGFAPAEAELQPIVKPGHLVPETTIVKPGH